MSHSLKIYIIIGFNANSVVDYGWQAVESGKEW